MARNITLAIASDIHYASAAEQAREDDYEIRAISQPVLRFLLRTHRNFIWLRRPLRQNHLLDRFLEQARSADFAVVNGDYTCDTSAVGVSDDACFQSARECLQKLRDTFGDRLRATFGDHEVGKLSLVGARGGMRLASYRRATNELGLEPLWKLELGRYLLVGITSSLVALPVFEPDMLQAERRDWFDLRNRHLNDIRELFACVHPDQRVVLFCHDPTALAFLRSEEAVQARLPQFEATVIGHLHSNLILWKSRLLAGMPTVHFMGHSIKRMSSALREARCWKEFKVRLVPALAGIELLKDGGFYMANLDPDAVQPIQFRFQPIRR